MIAEIFFSFLLPKPRYVSSAPGYPCQKYRDILSIFFISIPPQTVFVGGYTVFTLSVRPKFRPTVRAHEKTLVEYTWNSVHGLPHIHPPSKFLRFIINENHNGINLICIFKGNYKR